MKSTTKLALQIGNLAMVIIMIVVNMLAIILPLNGKTTQELSDAIPNYFAAANAPAAACSFPATKAPLAAFSMRSATACGCDT